MKNPLKLAKREFESCGAVFVWGDRRSVTYEFPGGRKHTVFRYTKLRSVRDFAQEMHARTDPLAEFVPREAPEVGRMHATFHFRDRVELMTGQGLGPDEIRDAVRRPTETRWCARTGSYAYVRGRVAVVAAPLDGGKDTALITALWTTEALWVENPRPGKRRRDNDDF